MDRSAAALLALALLAGCSSVPAPPEPSAQRCWDDAEQLGERVRLLPGVAQARALAAAEQVLRLAAGDELKVTRSTHAIAAAIDRERVLYLYLVAYEREVHERWAVSARPWPDGSELCVQVNGHYWDDRFAFGAEGIINVVYPASAREAAPIRLAPPAQARAVSFDTFWARLEYAAGLRRDWQGCPPGGALRTSEPRGRAEFDPLCHRLAEDAAPAGGSPAR